jgi:hypothetical protein
MHLQRSRSVLNSEVIGTYLREGVWLRLPTLRKMGKELFPELFAMLSFEETAKIR